MIRSPSLPLLLAALAASGCHEADTLGFDYAFARGPSGWVAGFADYPASDEAAYDLEADYRRLPTPLDTSEGALFIAGDNHSDDLWMYYKVQAFLEPNRSYRAVFEVEIATDVPSGCGGVGGPPGEGVTVKAGVSLEEPDRFVDASGFWRFNLDKGQQSSGGEDAVVLGDLANSRPCEEGFVFERKRLGGGGSLQVDTDPSGAVWLYVGTDSGFEARSAVYYTRFIALFDRIG